MIRKLLKVILISVILSLIISLVGSIMGYTPFSKRDPNVYYFSIGESFIFGMFYITPILLILSIIAFIIDILIGKIKRFPQIISVILSIFVAGSILALTLFLIDKSNETNDIYLIPKGFEGDVYAFYNIKGAPMVETEDGYDVHVINEKGYFLTSKPDMDYGTITDKYYYVDEEGNRTPISNKCVSSFGTGGYSTTEGDKVINFNYTGFKLTKDQCGDAFVKERFGMGEDIEWIIPEILKQYYDVDQ